MDLSLNLNAIIAQRLIPSLDGRYALATEVLVNSPFSAEIIRKGRMQELKDIIEKGGVDGMHTFDQSLAELYKNGKISRENALEHASSKNNLEWMLSFDSNADQESSCSINSKPVLAGVLPELD